MGNKPKKGNGEKAPKGQWEINPKREIGNKTKKGNGKQAKKRKWETVSGNGK